MYICKTKTKKTNKKQTPKLLPKKKKKYHLLLLLRFCTLSYILSEEERQTDVQSH